MDRSSASGSQGSWSEPDTCCPSQCLATACHALKGYTLDNAADLKTLFNQYGIQFGFSGHTHSQNIVKEDLGQVNYTEVVNGAFSIYSAIIGQLSLDDTSIHYQKLNLIRLRGQKSTNLVIQICRSM